MEHGSQVEQQQQCGRPIADKMNTYNLNLSAAEYIMILAVGVEKTATKDTFSTNMYEIGC